MAEQNQQQQKLRHIEYLDVNGDGVLREVAVVKRWPDGSVSYIDTMLLDQIDRGRLKNVLLGVHADKYELWELLSMATLSNGLNGLNYFHQLTRVLRAKGSLAINGQGGGIMDARPVGGKMVGSDFVNPGEFSVDGPKPI